MPPELNDNPNPNIAQPVPAPILNPQASPIVQPISPVPPPIIPQAIMAQNENGINISDVNKSLWQYLLHRKRVELLISIPLFFIWLLTISLMISAEVGEGTVYVIMLPFFLISGWYASLRSRFEAAFLEEFAASNGYNFTRNGGVDETYGTIFRIGHGQRASDIVSGIYAGSGLRLFIFKLTIGSGRYQKDFTDTVVELDLHGALPNLLMVNKHSKFGKLNIESAFGIKNTIQLEGDFNQHFKLYAPAGSQIEALEVFSPDTMSIMENESTHYTVEFAGNKIYIYCNGLITKSDNLNQIFTLAKQLINKIAPLASRLSNDSVIAAQPTNIEAIFSPFHRPSKRTWVSMVVLVIMFIILGIAGASTNSNSSNTSSQTSFSNSTAPLSSADTQYAVTVSNEYLSYLQANDVADAYDSETLAMQAKYSATLTLQMYQSMNLGSVTGTILKTGTGIDSNHFRYLSIVYLYNLPSGPFYVKTVLESISGFILVNSLQGSSTLLTP